MAVTTEPNADITPTTQGVDTMRAVTQDRYGTADVLKVTEVEIPVIAADEVLIEVHAAGVDRGTEHLMTGLPYAVRLAGYGIRAPKHSVVGFDVAGIVTEVGSGVTRFAVGDAVFGSADGSFADCARAKADKLAATPANITHEQAAAAAVSGITALQAVEDIGKVEAGQQVLVLGASGGVGSYAVQIAVAAGAVVTGIAGGASQDFVRSLGAADVYDYRTTNLSDLTTRFDAVIDAGGGNPVREIRKVMTTDGTLVFVGAEGGNRVTGGVGRQIRASLRSPFVSQNLKMFISNEHHSYMERLADKLASGAVTPAIGARYDLEHAADALRSLGAGSARGKTVVIVRPDAAEMR